MGPSPPWAGGSSCSSFLTPWISIRKSTPPPILLQPLGTGVPLPLPWHGTRRGGGHRGGWGGRDVPSGAWLWPECI